MKTGAKCHRQRCQHLRPRAAAQDGRHVGGQQDDDHPRDRRQQPDRQHRIPQQRPRDAGHQRHERRELQVAEGRVLRRHQVVHLIAEDVVVRVGPQVQRELHQRDQQDDPTLACAASQRTRSGSSSLPSLVSPMQLYLAQVFGRTGAGRQVTKIRNRSNVVARCSHGTSAQAARALAE